MSRWRVWEELTDEVHVAGLLDVARRDVDRSKVNSRKRKKKRMVGAEEVPVEYMVEGRSK